MPPTSAPNVPDPVAAVLALVLPSPEREPFARRTVLDIPFWSMMLGLVQVLGGTLYLFGDWHEEIHRITAEGMVVFAEARPGGARSFNEQLAVNWSGMLWSVFYFARPKTWLLASIPLVGMMRMITFAASREAAGELLVWLPLRIVQFFKGRVTQKVKNARFGPRRPDRFIHEPGSDLVLLTCRACEDWNENATIQIDDRFYRLIESGERRPPGERHDVYYYKLNEQGDNEVIRRLAAYAPVGIE